MEHVEEYVKAKWQQLTAFSTKEDIKERLWDELVYRYSGPHRHYHNLTHIAYIFSLCDKYFTRIKNPAVMGFAILYHDAVHDTLRHDNEEQSAAIAEIHLQKLRLNRSVIDNVKAFIAATKDHRVPENISLKDDLSLFLDFDMAILAEEPDTYKLYSRKIRMEYYRYDDAVYNNGRKEALKKMMQSTLYHTPIFKDLLEEKARINMEEEIATLTNA